MSTAATTPAPAPDPESRAFVDLAHQLLAVLRAESPDAATALDALIHTYVAIVRTHPQLSQAAQRSLLSAARALVASGGAPVRLTEPAALPAGRIH